MARKITQKQLKHDEFVDAAFDFGRWLEEHWKSVAQIVGLLFIVVVGGFFWVAWSNQRLAGAKQQLADGIDRYDAALAGGGAADTANLQAALAAFDEVTETLAGKAPGKLALFYRAAALSDLGRPDEARAALQDLIADSGPEETVGATARLLLARFEVAGGRPDDALALLGGTRYR